MDIPQLRAFIGGLTPEQRTQFAADCKTSLGHLKNVMYGFKSCATDLAVRIERNSCLELRRWHLRPEDWYEHWPDLIGAEGSPPSPANQQEARDAA